MRFGRRRMDHSLDDSFVAIRGVISRSFWSIPQWRMTVEKAARVLIDAVHTERFIYTMLNDFGCIDVYHAVQRLHLHLPKPCASMVMEYLKPNSQIAVCAVNGTYSGFNFSEPVCKTDNFWAWLSQSVFKDSVSRVAVCRFSDNAHPLPGGPVPAPVSDVCAGCRKNPPGSCSLCLPANYGGDMVLSVAHTQHTYTRPLNLNVTRAANVKWISDIIPNGWYIGVCLNRSEVRSVNGYRRELAAAGFRARLIDRCRFCASSPMEK